MSENKKPRLCEVLGVEINQEWMLDIPEYNDIINRINANGHRELKDEGEWYIAGWELMLVTAINHPEKIKRLPRWTTEEQKQAKAIKLLFPWAIYVQKESAAPSIIGYDDNGQTLSIYDENEALFPHLKDGEAVTLDDILKGG